MQNVDRFFDDMIGERLVYGWFNKGTKLSIFLVFIT